MTQAGAVPDLTAAADTLGRAAARLEKLAASATPGPWCFYDDDLWTGTPEALAAYDADPENVEWPYNDLGPKSGHLFLGDPGRPADAEFIAAMDPRAVAELVPVLRLGKLAADKRPVRALTEIERALVDLAGAFARRVLREEETGG